MSIAARVAPLAGSSTRKRGRIAGREGLDDEHAAAGLALLHVRGRWDRPPGRAGAGVVGRDGACPGARRRVHAAPVGEHVLRRRMRPAHPARAGVEALDRVALRTRDRDATGTPPTTNPRKSSVRGPLKRQRNDPERVSDATARVSTPKKPDRARTRLTGCPVCSALRQSSGSSAAGVGVAITSGDGVAAVRVGVAERDGSVEPPPPQAFRAAQPKTTSAAASARRTPASIAPEARPAGACPRRGSARPRRRLRPSRSAPPPSRGRSARGRR